MDKKTLTVSEFIKNLETIYGDGCITRAGVHHVIRQGGLDYELLSPRYGVIKNNAKARNFIPHRLKK